MHLDRKTSFTAALVPGPAFLAIPDGFRVSSIMARRRRVAAAGCLPSEGLSGIEKEMGVAVALGAALEHEPGGVSLLLPVDEKSESSGEMRERESVVPSLQPAHPRNPATPAGRREGGWHRAGARSSSSESSGPRRVGRSQARDLGTASYAATEAVTIAAAPSTGVQESDRRESDGQLEPKDP